MRSTVATDIANSWTSHPTLPNVLVVAPESAPYVQVLESMREDARHACEVVVTQSHDEALRVLRRANLAVVVIDDPPSEPGALPLILEGLSKDRPPRFVVFTATPDPRREISSGALSVVNPNMVGRSPRSTVLAATDAFRSQDAVSTRLLDLMRAACKFPDHAWLRIRGDNGYCGDLCLRAGVVVYAETGNLVGEAAAMSLLSWGASQFEYRDVPVFLKPNMSRTVMSLLDIVPMTANPLAEEPADLSFEEPDALSFGDSFEDPASAEPSSMQFAVPEASKQAEVQAPFQACAIISQSGDHVEKSWPESALDSFPAADLRWLYEQARRCTGETPLQCVNVHAAGYVLLLTSIEGDRLLAARSTEPVAEQELMNLAGRLSSVSEDAA
ncbi:MAG: DUF4388 domain-containing protein [Candidatus Solibacter usitatus]|nr:DUF4388 domain-containing protein [Candidatus Solibacter usitatus]